MLRIVGIAAVVILVGYFAFAEYFQWAFTGHFSWERY